MLICFLWIKKSVCLCFLKFCIDIIIQMTPPIRPQRSLVFLFSQTPLFPLWYSVDKVELHTVCLCVNCTSLSECLLACVILFCFFVFGKEGFSL